jgi:hypothetical protein
LDRLFTTRRPHNRIAVDDESEEKGPASCPDGRPLSECLSRSPPGLATSSAASRTV